MSVSPSDDAKIRSQLAKLEEDAHILAGTESVWALQEAEQTTFHTLKSSFMALLQFVGGNTANNILTELKNVGANINAISPREARSLAGMIMSFKAIYEAGLLGNFTGGIKMEDSSKNVVIFFSYSSLDEPIASVLTEQLKKSLASVNPQIFIAPDEIGTGKQWFNTILSKLEDANIMILLLTPHSIASGWVHFEFGYFWSKGKSIYPLRVPQTKLASPLNELQAKLITKRKDFEGFLRNLGDELGIATDTKIDFDFDLILNAVKRVSFESAETLASGEDAKETLRDFMHHEYKNKWITYNKLDHEKSLKTGSSKKYLKSVVEEDKTLNLIVEKETPTGIRFIWRSASAAELREFFEFEP